MSLVNNALPSLYEYYTTGGISSGLSTDQPNFTLNGKNISLYSGAMHYFRVPQEYWRDRLRKMRHAGLNAVETYIPWNLHEPQPGHFDFGDGGTDWQDFLDIQTFLKTAQEEDLFAIVRPGPFICAEWEFGGLPSWLLREKDIKIRTSDPKYMKHVKRFFNTLLPILAALQFTLGGPIIGFQVENEYGSVERRTKNNPFKPDLIYVEELVKLMVNNNIRELLFTSDSPTQHGTAGTIPKLLFQTANFDRDPEREFDKLKELQTNKPTMAMEFWSGWFDHWYENHYKGNVSRFADIYERILKYPASVNLYMFHGGTSFGFMNGANIKSGANAALQQIQSKFQPDITSYDYDAPLTEYGGYNPKYFVVKELLEKYNPIKTKLPDFVALAKIIAYNSVNIKEYIPYSEILKQAEYNIKSAKIIPMEYLPINNNTGQSYGYIIYRKTNIDLKENSELKIAGHIYDIAMIYINNKLVTKPLQTINDLNGFGYWRLKDGVVKLNTKYLKNATLDIVVENMGRVNFGQLEWFQQHKGLKNKIYINGEEISDFDIIPLEFKKSWTNNLIWQKYGAQKITGLGLYKGVLDVTDKYDTFVDMQNWTKGIVIVNGFVLGRYSSLGPQLALYLPSPLLNKGRNEIIIFEHFNNQNEILFSNTPIYKS